MPLPIPTTSRCGDTGSVSTRLSVDCFLELIHREDLSPADLRLLLRVTEREATIRELADAMALDPIVLRRASARLVARGLLRRRRPPPEHHPLEVTLAVTASAIDALCRLAQAPGVDLQVRGMPAAADPSASRASGRVGQTARLGDPGWR